MGLFDKLTGKAKRKEQARLAAEAEEKKKQQSEERKAKREAAKAAKAAEKSAKDLATAKGEPYISIVSVELDPENIGNGAFELDWNDKFIANLVRAGYQLKANESEDVIVDRWFQEICKNVVAENYEQWEANQPSDERLRTVGRKDLGNGRTEIS